MAESEDRRILARALVATARAAGLAPRAYRGRGTAGRECVGVPGDVGVVGGLLVRAARAGTPGLLGLGEAADLLAHATRDTAGRERVVFWPALPWPPGEAAGGRWDGRPDDADVSGWRTLDDGLRARRFYWLADEDGWLDEAQAEAWLAALRKGGGAAALAAMSVEPVGPDEIALADFRPASAAAEAEALRGRLDRLVRARNALRSAEANAAGFAAGRRVAGLRIAAEEAGRALEALADWTERRAREALGLPGPPGGVGADVAPAAGGGR